MKALALSACCCFPLGGTPPAADLMREASQANALLQAGSVDQAITIYRKLAASLPNEPSITINLIVALYKGGRYRETIQESEALVKDHPDLFPAWLFLGASRSKLADFENAEMPLRRALALKPDDPNAHIMLADVLSAKGKNAEAAAEYESSEATMPDSSRVWYGLDHSYEQLARDRLHDIEQAAPGSAEALALSAEFEMEDAQWLRAFQHLRHGLNLKPGFHGLHARIAAVYEMTGHPDWAVAEGKKEDGDSQCGTRTIECAFVAGHLNEAVSQTATSVEGMYWQARACLALSRRAYERLRALPPTREIYEAEAIADENRGRYPEAVTAWKGAIQADPSDPELQRRLALALCHSNDCGSALPLLKELLVQEESSAELNYLCGLALVTARNPTEAISYLETAIRLDSSFTPARGALGEAYLESGKPEQAVSNLKLALANDETGSRHYQLARAYQALGMRAESVQALRSYRDIEQQNSPASTQYAITPP